MPHQMLYVGRIDGHWMVAEGLHGQPQQAPALDGAGFGELSWHLHKLYPKALVVAGMLEESAPPAA